MNQLCPLSLWLEPNKVQCCRATARQNPHQRRLSAHFLSIMGLCMLYRLEKLLASFFSLTIIAFEIRFEQHNFQKPIHYYGKLLESFLFICLLTLLWFNLQRNPFFPKNFLTIGDWTARVRFPMNSKLSAIRNLIM